MRIGTNNVSKTIKVRSNFKYRFQCEHCDQTTDWINDSIIQTKNANDQYVFEKICRSLPRNRIREEFIKRLPELQKEVEAGNYFPLGGELKGRCPYCNMRQSWEKIINPFILFGVAVFGGLFAWFGLYMFNSGASEDSIFKFGFCFIGVVAFLFGFIGGISRLKMKSSKKSDTKYLIYKRKPEFIWSNDATVY